MTVRYDVRLSRAEGYRKLGMYADACWELEELEGDDRLSDPVLGSFFFAAPSTNAIPRLDRARFRPLVSRSCS